MEYNTCWPPHTEWQIWELLFYEMESACKTHLTMPALKLATTPGHLRGWQLTTYSQSTVGPHVYSLSTNCIPIVSFSRSGRKVSGSYRIITELVAFFQ